MILAVRDPFGFNRLHYHLEYVGEPEGGWAPTIRGVIGTGEDMQRTLDRTFITRYLAGELPVGRTILEDVRAVPPGHALIHENGLFVTELQPVIPRRDDLGRLLRRPISTALAAGKRAAVALSGGLDSAVILGLALEIENIPAYVLTTSLPNYCERDAALRTARAMGAEVVLVEVTADDIGQAVRDVVGLCETPLYNLHPVAKLLLARALRRDGVEMIISGDGADQVWRRDTSADYLPLVKALFDGAGVELRSPFLEPEVIAHILSTPPDSEKSELRRLASDFPVPAELVTGKKISRLAPPIDLARHVRPGLAGRLADILHQPGPPLEDDREQIRWLTMALLIDEFEAWP